MESTNLNGAVVLVIEDHPANMLLTRAILQRAGMQPREASSAEEALDWLKDNRPDVILMDVQLPGQDGLSLTRQLKAAQATAEIPIVALTAHAMAADREKALSAGCDDFDTKPVDIARLVAKIEALAPDSGAPA